MGSRHEHFRNKFLEGPQQAAMLRAIFPQATFLPKEPAIHAPVNLRSLALISEVAALINSGATDNFTSPQVVQCFKMPTQNLDKPKSIRNVDGTLNRMGAIEQSTDLILRYQRKTYIQMFYIADLGGDHILLGMPFLSAANPRINWTHNHFHGKVEASAIDAHYQPLPRQSVDPEQMKEDLQIDYDTTLFDQCIKDYTDVDLSNI
jgi:hypothetical protein